MKLYELVKQTEGEIQYVKFNSEQYSDIFRFFVMGVDNGISSKHIKASFQGALSISDYDNLDALNLIINVPMFSERLVSKIGDKLSIDADFYPCLINNEYKYYLCRIKTRLHLINLFRSEYLTLSRPDEKPVLSVPVYYSETTEDFYLARDIHEQTKFLLSERFRQAIMENNLNVKLKEVV
ncbi:TPA: hypothetical protein RFX11_001055 [Klebsiella aerogenes]|nr:hypothetical protein [Klebsiella aerogenes]